MNNQADHTHLTFIPTFTPQQMRLINNLVGHALVSHQLAYRLVTLRDESLVDEFDLTPETWEQLKIIEAHDLQEFCSHLAHLQNGALVEIADKQSSMV